MKRIGILTSGGDAPGMNAAIRAAVRTALSMDMTVLGFEHGYNGLIQNRFQIMTSLSVSGIISRGGTILKTARSEEFKTKEGQQKALDVIRREQVDGMITMGGDGTFIGARILTDAGVPTIGVPCTIDNDLSYTDYTIGFDTAINTVVDAINKIRDTSTSHDRISVVEVMGRHCGDIALYAGMASGVDDIIVPEVPWSLEVLLGRLMEKKRRGKAASIIVLAEGAAELTTDPNQKGFTGDELADILESKTGSETRATTLGHIQRGGNPTATDRVLATRMSAFAVELLARGVGGHVVGISKNELVDYDIEKALGMERCFDKQMHELAERLSF